MFLVENLHILVLCNTRMTHFHLILKRAWLASGWHVAYIEIKLVPFNFQMTLILKRAWLASGWNVTNIEIKLVLFNF